MDQRIDGACHVETVRQPLQQLGDQHGVVSEKYIVSQTHLRLLRLDFGDRNISHFAPRAAGGGQNDELLILH